MSGIEIMHRMPKQRHGFEFTVLFVSYVGSGVMTETTEWEIILLGSDDTTEEGAKFRAVSEMQKQCEREMHPEDAAVIDLDVNRPSSVSTTTLDKGKAYKVRFYSRQYWV